MVNDRLACVVNALQLGALLKVTSALFVLFVTKCCWSFAAQFGVFHGVFFTVASCSLSYHLHLFHLPLVSLLGHTRPFVGENAQMGFKTLSIQTPEWRQTVHF